MADIDMDFAEAVRQQTKVLSDIQDILKANKMRLLAGDEDWEGNVYLYDDGRDIGYTGFYLNDQQ